MQTQKQAYIIRKVFYVMILLSIFVSSSGISDIQDAYAQDGTTPYINNYDGYTIYYPTNWYIHPSTESGAGTDIFKSTPDSAEFNQLRLNIIAFNNENNLSIQDWHDAYISETEPISSGRTLSGDVYSEYIETIYDFLDYGPLVDMKVKYINGDKKIFRFINFCDNEDCTQLDNIINSFILNDINISNLSFPVTYNIEDMQIPSEVSALGQHLDQDPPISLHAPWQFGDSYILSGSYYGEGAHNDANNDYYATDWNKVGTSCDGDAGQPVMAAGTGVAILARNYDPGLNSGGKVVRIQSSQDSSVTFAIYHLQDVTVSENQSISSLPAQIGTVGETGMDTSLPSTCAHIHLSVRRTVSGVTYSIRPGNLSGQSVYDGVTITSQNGGGGGGGGTGQGCDQVSYNGVRLYEHANCNRDTNGATKSFSSATGLTDIVSDFNDITSSIYVGSGWSVKVFERSVGEGGGSWRCMTGSMWDLNVDYYTNGDVNRKINDDISSVQVYNNNNCGSGGGSSASWNARYFNGQDHWWDNNNFNNQMCEETINTTGLDKNYGSSAPCGNGVSDNWVAEYNSTVYFPAGSYVFYAQNDDGLKIWVNGSNIMERGGSSGYYPRCPALNLNGNTPIRAILREEGGDARVKIAWSTETSVCIPPGSFNKSSPSNGATGVTTSPTLIWGSSSNSGGYYYCIDTSNNNNCDTGWQSVGSLTSKPLSGLTAGTTYYWQARSNNEGGEVFANNGTWWSFTTQPLGPGTPSLNTPASNTTINRTDSINLIWNTASGATQYYAEFWGGPSVNLNSGWTSNTSWTLGSQWGGSYQWRVKARNGSGQESAWSETRTLTVKPGTPSNLSTTVLSSDQIALTWTKSSDGPGNIDGYRIYRNGVAVGTVPGSSTTYQNNGLTCNTSYSFYVRAYKGSVESNSSNAASASTHSCPPAIRAIEAGTRDGNWTTKTTFNPNDPIQWIIVVENITGSGNQVVLGFLAKDPSNNVILDSEHTVTTDNGTVTWGLPGTVNLPGGTYTFTGSVTYQGVKTQRTTTYIVTGSSGAPTFGDVPTSHPYFRDIEILYANGLTAGCSTESLLFCPEQTMNRAQSAVFMVRGNFGTSYSPPPAPWTTFGDNFAPGPWAQPWAQGMFDAGLTAGCSTSPRLFCPWEEMPRFQAAVFGLRMKYGISYPPPSGTGTVFADVNGSEWYAGWVEQAYAEGMLPACGSSAGKPLFCPNDLVSRGLGAYMIVRAKNLSMP